MNLFPFSIFMHMYLFLVNIYLPRCVWQTYFVPLPSYVCFYIFGYALAIIIYPSVCLSVCLSVCQCVSITISLLAYSLISVALSVCVKNFPCMYTSTSTIQTTPQFIMHVICFLHYSYRHQHQFCTFYDSDWNRILNVIYRFVSVIHLTLRIFDWSFPGD